MEDISGLDPFDIRIKQIKNNEMTLSEFYRIGRTEENEDIDSTNVINNNEQNQNTNTTPNTHLKDLFKLEVTPDDLKNQYRTPNEDDSEFMKKLNDFINENEFSEISSEFFEKNIGNLNNKKKITYNTNFIEEIIQDEFQSINLDITELHLESDKFIGNIYKSEFEDIYSYRYVLNDGDSFYRCIIYSLLENYIFYKKVNELNKIIYDIINLNLYDFKNDKLKIERYEKNCVTKIFEHIIQFFDIENLTTYFNYRIFDNILIKYTKNKIFNYLKDNIKFRNDRNLKNEIFQLKNSLEPKLLYYIPFIFDINLNITIYNSKNIKKLISFNLNKNKYTINLVYFEHSYKLQYSNELFNNLSNICNYKLYKDTNFKISNFNPPLEKDVYCKLCSDYSDFITLKNMPFKLCKNYLMKILKSIISKKLNNLIKNNFKNSEYFMQYILLDTKIRIDKKDFKFLFDNKNIFEIIKGILIEKKCKNCNKNLLKKEDFNILICDNLFCLDCIQNEINTITNGFNYLNDFERKIIFKQINDKNCKCGENFHFNNCLHILYNPNEINDLKTESEERNINYLNNFCCYCGKLHESFKLDSKISDVINKNKLEKFKNKINIRLKDDNEFLIMENHFICINCYKQLKNIEKLRKNNEMERNLKKIPLSCIICNKIHFIDCTKLKKEKKFCGGCLII